MILILLGVPAVAAAQDPGAIQGTVIDAATLSPIAGAQVIIPGSGQGVFTRDDGTYLLVNVPAGQTTLRAEMIGYGPEEQEVEVPAGGTATVDFDLSSAAINLEEIVVTGSGASTELRRLGNSVTTLQTEGVAENAPVSSVQDLLQARAPGVAVLPSGGTVGSSGLLRVRGVTTLSQTENPLVYIDGVRVDVSSGGPNVSGQAPSRLLDIIPSDIARIEVIKGAAAATLYGTEASNGVVQIFTKRGQSGEPRWTFQVEQGLERVPSTFPGTLYPNFVGPTGVRARDTNEIIETGHQQSYSLSLSGGAESLTYYISGSYKDHQGSIVPEVNHLEQASGRLNLTVLPYETLSLLVNMGYVHTGLRLPNNDNSVFGVSGNATAGVPYQATEERRWGENFLPVSEAMRIENMQNVDRFTGGLTVEHRPADLLNHTLTFGLDVISQRDTEFFPYGFEGPFYPDGRKVDSRTSRTNATLDYRLALNNQLSDNISSSFATGAQGAFERTSINSVEGRDFPGPGLSMASAAAVITGTEGFVEEVNAGVFAEETIGINDRLFITGGLRVDGNSAFGDEFTHQVYPKASVAYNISEAGFWPLDFWPTLKLRAAYGTSGLAPAQFAADRTWDPTSVLGGVPAVTPGNLGDPNLGPETSREFEVGFDAGLFEDRLGVVATYYNQKTVDALLGVPAPPSLGFTGTQLRNVGEVRNEGLELQLTNIWLTGADLEWETGLGLSFQDNEIVDLGDRDAFAHGWGSSARAVEGYPIYGKWLPGTLEWDPATRTHSVSGDPVFVGPSIPTYRGSVSNTLTLFGRVTVYGLLDWAGGHYVANITKQFQTQGRTGDTYLALVDAPHGERTPAGDSLFNYVTTMGNSSFISPGDFLKLRELSVSYQVPNQWLERFALGGLSLRLAARNLLTFTDYEGVDPEVNWMGSSDFRGAEFYTIPPARSVSLAIRTTF